MKSTQLKSILVAALLLMTLNAAGAPIDTRAALDIATRYLASQHDRFTASEPKLVHVYSEPSASNASLADFHVFNHEDGQGFIIVGGDDRTPGVLAHGNKAIDMANIPDNARWLLDEYKREMEYLRSHPEFENTAPPISAVSVAPMLNSTWGQDYPFSCQSPTINGFLCLTGCVATAAAQVLYYWRYPQSMPALNGYVTRTTEVEVLALPATTISYSSMLNSYAHYNTQNANAVGTLMRYIGQACHMNYDILGSGAFSYELIAALKAFGYNREASHLTRDDFTAEQWNEMILSDLQEGRPVIYFGRSETAGHCFVLDGCSAGMYHVNWGWNGNMDGFFMLSTLGLEPHLYNYDHEMFYQVYPDKDAKPTYDYADAGIYYTINGDQATVVSDNLYGGTYSGHVTVPETINHEGTTITVSAIDYRAFSECPGLISVDLPPSIKTIGQSAFAYSQNISSIAIPDGVTHIGIDAFSNCSSLTDVTMGSSVKEIGSRAFYLCKNIQRVNIRDLGTWCAIDFATTNANPLCPGACVCIDGQPAEEIILPEGVTTITPYAFYNARGFSKVSIPNTVTSIKHRAFEFCEDITEVTMGNQVKEIDEYVFYGCDSIKRVNISDVGAWCQIKFNMLSSNPLHDRGALYMDNRPLTNITIPSSVQAINEYAFNSCSNLATVRMGNSVTRVGQCAFQRCVNLKNISLSPMITKIETETFDSCCSLAAIVIPDRVTAINDYAFSGCSSLQTVTLGNRLHIIRNGAFRQCSAITSITSKATAPPTIESKTCFPMGVYNNATVSVPEASVNRYKQDSMWKYFANIVPINTSIDGDVNGDSEVNIADVNALVDNILLNNAPTSASDINGDGEINIADVNALIDMILNGQ